MLEHRDRKFLENLNFFQSLPPEESRYLLDSAHSRGYNKHTHIHEQERPVDGFDIVLEGWIRLYRTTQSGKMASSVMLTPGDTYGQSLIILGYKRNLYNAYSVKPARVARIPADLFEERVRHNPQIMYAVNQVLFSRMMSAQRKSEQMALMSADQRVACHLLYLSADLVGKGARFPLPYDKYEIAHHLGLSPESFSRALRHLEAADVHVHGGEITISNFAELAETCRPDCAAGPQECRCAQRLPSSGRE